MQSHLSAAHFHSEEAAYAYVEARLWPNGPVCPHCGPTEEKAKRELPTAPPFEALFGVRFP